MWLVPQTTGGFGHIYKEILCGKLSVINFCDTFPLKGYKYHYKCARFPSPSFLFTWVHFPFPYVVFFSK